MKLRYVETNEIVGAYHIAIIALAVQNGWFPPVRKSIFRPSRDTIPDWNSAVDYLVKKGIGILQ